tara:strand:- start:999 stop:1262 length:264 start_codon:yes stop_codon:yes gene_type:complete
MVSKDSIKIGDYVRWLYPLGYIDLQRRNFSYGLVMNVREEEDEQSIDGKIVLLLDSGYKQTFWLSLDLLIELGNLELLVNGEWRKVK